MVTVDYVVDYVMESPLNTNKTVLRHLLQQLIKDNQEEEYDVVIYDGGDVNGYGY